MSAERAVRKARGCGSQPTADLSRGNGADDESPRGDFESGRRETDVDGGGGDYGGDGPHDAALAGAVTRAWLRRIMGLPPAATEPEARADADGGAGFATLSRPVLRFQRATFLRKAA